MYRCQFCNKTPAPRTACKSIVTKKVTVFYPFRPKANRSSIIEKGRKKRIYIDDPGGQGWQILNEAKVCPTCAVKYEKEQQEKELNIKDLIRS